MNHSFVKSFLVLMTIVCLYQFSLMMPTYLVEQQAQTNAAVYSKSFPLSEREVVKQAYEQHYLDYISDKVIFKIPYIKQYTYNDLKKQQLQLGLDLKGGMQVTIGIDKKDFLQEMARHNADALFLKALEDTEAVMATTDSRFISSFFDHYQALASTQNIRRMFASHTLLKEFIDSSTSLISIQEQLQELLREKLIDTQHLLHQRINGLGLSQTSIVVDKEKQYIRVEIPGAKHPERIRELVSSTASLSFWKTYRITDPGIIDAFIEADKLVE